MGLFDLFKKKDAPTPASAPEAISVSLPAGCVGAPVNGKVNTLVNVPDPVFASGAMGPGCGIWPAEDVVRSPVTGTVSVTCETNHAVGLASDDGLEVLVHVGIDTVEMGGKGFTRFVEQGQHVTTGQPLLRFDRDAIAVAGHKDVVILAVTNADDLGGVEVRVADDAQVATGDVVVATA